MRLGVNIDHVATLRQARRGQYPDPVHAAVLAELAGAEQITLHVREDRRHVNDRDLEVLRKTVQGALNLEMASIDAMVELALRNQPDTCTLVPARREELTTEGGLDVVTHRDNVERVTRALRDGGVEVSLFIDPEIEQVRASVRCNANAVELHTGRYCEAKGEGRTKELHRLIEAAHAASKLGLRVAAGHGLDYQNVRPVAAIQEITELNIGYAIVCRAVLVGFERAVRDMKALIG
jgi:pyridoxine 5-phosphate synthase